MNDLWRHTQDQRVFVEVHVLRKNHQVTRFDVSRISETSKSPYPI